MACLIHVPVTPYQIDHISSLESKLSLPQLVAHSLTATSSIVALWDKGGEVLWRPNLHTPFTPVYPRAYRRDIFHKYQYIPVFLNWDEMPNWYHLAQEIGVATLEDMGLSCVYFSLKLTGKKGDSSSLQMHPIAQEVHEVTLPSYLTWASG